MLGLPVAVLVSAAALIFAAGAAADVVSIGVYSRRENPSRAQIGGSVRVGYRSPGVGASGGSFSPSRSSSSSASGPPAIGGASSGVQGVSMLSSGAAILRDSTPLGAGSFWMSVNGQRCIYAPNTNGTCFNVAPGAGGPGARPIDPRALAQAAAQRLPLLPGAIVASPSRQATGLTGAPSWFWLDPAPGTEPLTVGAGGEHVTVTAVPSKVVWGFGDGEQVDGGAGRPWGVRAGSRGSVQHRYRTRCLPGDQGHDPYVLSSCTASGYRVQASVEWTISFVAAGPIATAGGLPPRTTSTTIAYPVNEVRGFLTSGGAR